MPSIASSIDFAIIVMVAMIFIYIGGASMYMHSKMSDEKKNPLYFSIGIAFAGAGGSIISHMVMGALVPPNIRAAIREAKADGRF